MKSGINKYKKQQQSAEEILREKGIIDPDVLNASFFNNSDDDDQEENVIISQAAAEKYAAEALIEDVEIQINESEKLSAQLSAKIASTRESANKNASSPASIFDNAVKVKEELGSREDIIRKYAPLTKYIAQKIAARLPASIELDDLISSGVIGLMDAIEKYDPSRDNKFKTYAEFRIRGAILDELRSQDWVPRSVREKAKTLERAYARIEQSKGRPANEDDICEDLKISKEEYFELLSEVRAVSLLSYDDLSNITKGDRRNNEFNDQLKSQNPFSEMNTHNIKKMVSEAINELPEKQRLVLSLYYFEDLNLKEIGKVLDVTESRVSQLHTQAIIKLKTKLKFHFEEFQTLFL